MSSRTFHRWVLRTTKDGSRFCASPSARPTSAPLGSILASSPSFMNGSVVAPPQFQTRYFHPTPACRLFESSEAIVGACLGIAGGILLTRYLLTKSFVIPGRETSKLVPPASWWYAADEKTFQDVKTIISAGFEMARKAPIQRRDQAYREASFQVPYEIARLNPDAPQFKVEEMAPLSSIREVWQNMAEGGIHVKPPFNVERDARVFLYFPNGSAKATAAFLAINAEYTPLARQLGPATTKFVATDDQWLLHMIATKIWICQTVVWERRTPDVLHRMPTRLPVIITFRGSAIGALWDSSTSLFPDLSQFQYVFKFD